MYIRLKKKTQIDILAQIKFIIDNLRIASRNNNM